LPHAIPCCACIDISIGIRLASHGGGVAFGRLSERCSETRVKSTVTEPITGPKRWYGLSERGRRSRLIVGVSAALPLFGSWLALELGYLVFFAVSGLVPLRLYPTGLGERWPILGEPTRGLTRLIGTSPVGGAAPSGDWRAVALFATTLLF